MNPGLVGALLGGLAVIAGAFGAHALRERLDAEQLEWWATAAQYQLVHALALLAVAALLPSRGGGASWCFLLGTCVFSGTLYAMALGAPRWFGAITPIGGTLLIVGWLLLAWSLRGR